jgi:predicted porin
VWFGRDYTPAFFVGVKSDPFGWDGVGQVGIGQYADYRSTSSTQVNDAVGYKSPNIGGFSTAITVSMGEGVKARENGANIEYMSGPLYVGVGYGGLEGGGSTTDGNRIINAGLTYDLGFIKPMLYAAQTKTAGGEKTNKMFMIGALAPVGASVFKVAYGQIDPDGANDVQKKFSLGYEYYLSKRTNIYVDAGLAREERKTNNNAYALGLRHKF